MSGGSRRWIIYAQIFVCRVRNNFQSKIQITNQMHLSPNLFLGRASLRPRVRLCSYCSQTRQSLMDGGGDYSAHQINSQLPLNVPLLIQPNKCNFAGPEGFSFYAVSETVLPLLIFTGPTSVPSCGRRSNSVPHGPKSLHLPAAIPTSHAPVIKKVFGHKYSHVHAFLPALHSQKKQMLRLTVWSVKE